MNQELVRAIEDKRRIRFQYHGTVRYAEPQCYGVGTSGRELLRVHQLRGGPVREPLFCVDEMTGLEVLDEAFTRPGPNFKRNDSAMRKIFAQL